MGAKRAWLRNGLVVFQFLISVVLIVCTLLVNRQLTFIQNRKLGFDRDQVVTTNLFWHERSWIPRYQTVKKVFLQHPNITRASASLSLIGIWTGRHYGFRVPGGGDRDFQFRVHPIDEDFVELFGLNIVTGRNISENLNYEGLRAEFLLNESAVEALGWTDPVGRQIEWPNQEGGGVVIGTVVGVVKDYHTHSLHNRIEPVVLCNWVPWYRYISLKIRPENVPETLTFIESKWKEILPNRPFQYAFLDERIDGMYDQERTLSRILTMFFLLAIFVACLGLLGLTSFTIQQRTKEIAIRKILGAPLFRILLLLSRGLLILVTLANLIAWPIVYYAITHWLQTFAYRIDIGWQAFAAGGAIALSIALLVVSYQTVRSALANPVDALRYE